MFNIGDLAPWAASWLQDALDWLSGDPVQLGTGMLTDSRTDLAVADSRGPADVTRTYWQGDTRKRAFGIGRDLSYNAFLHSEKQYQEVDLYLPGGSKVHFTRTSPGTGYRDRSPAVASSLSGRLGGYQSAKKFRRAVQPRLTPADPAPAGLDIERHVQLSWAFFPAMTAVHGLWYLLLLAVES
ncbi:DUF6531 domain-containing protein [Streptomyces sp. 35M1]|uniref:DUF6531 domain-containing protein n=1 Tax=Streptomyces sp. 35M1 TaxID=3142978 RepID=UPI0039906C90